MDEQEFQDYRLLDRLSRSASGDLYRAVAHTGTQELLLQQLPLELPAEQLAQDMRWLARPVAALGRPAVSRIVSSGQSDGVSSTWSMRTQPASPCRRSSLARRKSWSRPLL